MNDRSIKILHTSDWHIGRVLHERPLLEDQWHALEQVIRILVDDPHDVLVVAGDIYDRSLPSAEAVALLSRFFTELRKVSPVPVVMIPGNHDSALRLAYCADILSLAHVHIRADARLSHEPLRLDAKGRVVKVHAIPFLEPGVFDVHGDDEGGGKWNHEDAIRLVLRRMEETGGDDDIRICVGHLYARTGKTSDSERLFIGGAGDVDPGLFSGFAYTALGHLHRPQGVSDTVHYSGSIMKYSFSECGDEKRVISVSLGKGIEDLRSISLRPFRDMARLRGSFQSLLNSREFLPFRDHYVEAELTDGGIIMNPLASLRERFPHILSVRQAAPERDSGERRAAPSVLEKGTVEDDYRAFHEHIHDREATAEKMELFEKIRRERSAR